MQSYYNLTIAFLSQPPVWFIVLVSIVAFITIVAQMALFEKCHQEWWAALVPVYNVIVFLRILGRPAWHLVFFLVPLYNIYFGFKLLIEICQCLGQTRTADYILVIILSGLYVFHMAMTEEIKYLGPVYGAQAQKNPDGSVRA